MKPVIWTSKEVLHRLIFPVICLLVFSLTIFWFTEGEVSRDNYWKIQIEWFLATNQSLSSWPTLFANLTQLGDALILLPIISFLIIWKPQAWAAIFGAIPLGTLLSVGGKELAAIPRPAAVLDIETFTVIGRVLKGYNSLPSGHTIAVFGVMTAVLLVFVPLVRTKHHYWVVVFGLFVATFLSVSRIAVGVHWPLDVLAGAALGYLAGLSGVILTRSYLRWWHWIKAEKYYAIVGIIMLIWSVELLNEAIEKSNVDSIVIWLAAGTGFLTSLYLLVRGVSYFYKVAAHMVNYHVPDPIAKTTDKNSWQKISQ